LVAPGAARNLFCMTQGRAAFKRTMLNRTTGLRWRVFQPFRRGLQMWKNRPVPMARGVNRRGKSEFIGSGRGDYLNFQDFKVPAPKDLRAKKAWGKQSGQSSARRAVARGLTR
jgi:hypothetical protein